MVCEVDVVLGIGKGVLEEYRLGMIDTDADLSGLFGRCGLQGMMRCDAMLHGLGSDTWAGHNARDYGDDSDDWKCVACLLALCYGT